MKRNYLCLLVIIIGCISLYSCESCAKKTSKKITEIGISAIEGVAEAIQERGDTLGQLLTNASGEVLEGVGRSLNRQLEEHAEDVASVVGRTMVQTLDGLGEGIQKEYYHEFISKEDLCDGVSISFFGRIDGKNVADGYFTIMKKGSYSFDFEFCSDNCNTVLLTKKVLFDKASAEKEEVVVSFAYTTEEAAIIEGAKCVKVIVKK